MVTPSTREEVFGKMREDPNNQQCFDCKSPEVNSASVSHGIFLCENCAEQHKELGAHISFTRSLTDNWSIRQLKIMTAGGNSSLQQFFQMYNMPEDSRIDYKYKTKAAKYYREMLKVMAQGEPCELERPSLEEGLLVEDEVLQSSSESFLEGLYSKTLGFGKQLYSKASELEAFRKAEELAQQVGEGIKKGAQYGIESLEKGLEQGMESLEWGAQQGMALGDKGINYLKTGALSAYGTLTQGAAETYHVINENQRVKQIKEDTMSMLNSLESTVKEGAGRAYELINSPQEETKEPQRPSTPPEYK